MKKLLALLLAMVMLLGAFAGCGKKDDKTNNQNDSGKNAANQQAGNNETTGDPTDPKPEQIFGVAIGTELDAPEKVFNADAMEMFYISFDRKIEGKMENAEVSLTVAEDGSILLYAVNGPGDNKEAIYKIAEEDTTEENSTEVRITKYIKGSGKNPFKPDDKTTPDEVKVEITTLLSYLEIFTQYQSAFTGIKYRKAADVTVNCPTGDVYIYDVVSAGKVVGQVCIDKETGLLVKAKDLADGKVAGQFYINENGELAKATEETKDKIANTVIEVNAFKTAGVEIPAYSNGETTEEGETPEGETPEGETPVEGETPDEPQA